LLTYPVVQDIL